MKRTSIIFILLATFIGLILWYGYTIPVQHTAIASEHYDKTAPEVWSAIIQHEKYPEWHEDVYAIKELPTKVGYQSWKEVDADGNTVPFIILEHSPNVQLTIQTDDKTMDINYKRTYDLIPDTTHLEKGTTLKITENGEIHNFLFRVITHFFSGHSGDIDTFLRSLKNKFITDDKANSGKEIEGSSNP
jgi:hypothetical protein